MKRTFRIATYLSAILAMAGLPLSTIATAATDPQLTLTATTSQMRQIGQTAGLSISVENSDTAAIKTQLRYDNTKLRYQSATQTGNSFSAIVVDSTNPGVLSIEATGGSGDAATPRRITTLTFTAERVGSTAIMFDGVNQIETQNCLLFICNKVYKDVTTGPALVFNLKAVTKPPAVVNEKPDPDDGPATPPAKNPTQQPKPSENKPTKDVKPTKPFAITALSVSQVTSLSAVVTIETTVASRGTISYGSDDKADMLHLKLSDSKTTHRVELSSLMPSTQYSVEVAMQDGSKAPVRSTVTFRTVAVLAAFTRPTKDYTATTNSSVSLATVTTVSLAAVTGLGVIGWIASRVMGALHKASLLEASLLVSRRHILRRFARLK